VCLGPGFSLKRGTTYNYLDYVLNFKTNLKVILEKQKQYGFSLTVKFHPGDPHEDMVKNECLTAKVEAKYITNEMSAIEVLREADLVIVAWSTICLEAALLNKPIIIMNNNIGYCQPYDFVEDGLGIFAEDKYSLANLIDKFFKEALIPGLLPDSKKTIDLHKYEKFQDGGASRRAADFILQNIS
jgi:CDP-glycerol glycerophosphotransferase (TagB/SpsB family)